MQSINNTRQQKTPNAAEPLDKEQHSMYHTPIGQLLLVKELSTALQQPDNEDLLKNLTSNNCSGTSKAPLIPKSHLHQKLNTTNKDKSKFTLSQVQT
eukprot:1329554-Amphidinium_carterae.1